jgi:hypothetical protein
MRGASSAVGFTSAEALVRVTSIVPKRGYSLTSFGINALKSQTGGIRGAFFVDAWDIAVDGCHISMKIGRLPR